MVAKRVDAGNSKRRRRPPAATPEAREMQLQALAYDLVEQRLLDGTATAQEVTYFLKSSSRREKLELERLEQQKRLDEAKISQIGSMQGQEQLLRDAMRAFTEYSGGEVPDEDDPL